MEQVILNFNKDMHFTANVSGHTIELDAAAENGGGDIGARPKALLLAALGGCTGMDIASLARKMRVDIKALTIEADAEKSVDEVPMIYTSAKLVYRFEASQGDRDKIVKMVAMSQERYCGVSSMLQKAFPISYEIFLNSRLLTL